MKQNLTYLICFLVTFLTLHTATAQTPDKKLTLPEGVLTGFEVIKAVKDQAGLRLNYGEAVNAKLSAPVSVGKRQVTAKEALEIIRKTYGIHYEISSGYITLTNEPAVTGKDAAPQKQQPGRISGKVTEDRGEALPGASVKIVQLNKGFLTSVDGSYTTSLAPGTYTIEVSFMGYQAQRITGIVVTGNKNTSLNIVMKRSTGKLNEVVVTSTYQRASVAGLYARQKNAASVTDGISAEQIAHTPDNNMGEVLKRVSGVTTVNNKYVVVRGLSDRYNQAMIDGIVLPSTNMNKRNFSFDALPQEMVSNVVVNKTATPELSAEFSGGQISVQTLDIPVENFTVISIGTAVNSQSTGKEFLTLGERNAQDYLGFDDGRRKQPSNMQAWYWPTQVEVPPPGIPGQTDDLMLTPGGKEPYSSLDAIAQSKRISNDGLKMRGYRAMPYQNYRVGIGRVYDLKNDLRLGFAGGASLRNRQDIVPFNNVRGQQAQGASYMDSATAVQRGTGTSYRFNTTLGAVLNAGLQGKTFKIALKNMYSRLFDDNFNDAYRLHYQDLLNPPKRQLFQEPQVTSVWQHKLEGEQLLPAGLKLDYSGSVTRIGQKVLDQRRLTQRFTATIGGVDYYQTPDLYNNGQSGVSGLEENYRMWTDIKETDYNWNFALSRSFGKKNNFSTLAKLGYSGWNKHRTLSVMKLTPYTAIENANKLDVPYDVVLDPANMGFGKGMAYYYVDLLNGPTFDGTMKMSAFYAMLDQQFFKKLRLVYGLRAEHYNLANRQEEFLARQFAELPDYYKEFATTGEKDWRFLPSVNAIYALTPKMNMRAAYSKTAVRPDFRETSYFGFYDYELDANISGRQVVSTIIDNLDLRYEWYPQAGEIISVSGFYKWFKDPIELIFAQEGQYRFQNQYAAVNYGLEMEFRKSMGFIANKNWLRNLTLFGNGSLVKSKVEIQTQPMPAEIPEGKKTERLPGQDRPLYGQSPWIVNAGIDYQSKSVGFTASYNRSGYRSFTIHNDPNQVEFERGRNLLDLQVRTSILKQKAEIKLNLGNLLDEWNLFYTNNEAYLLDLDAPTDWTWKLVKGSNKYEKDKGDKVVYRHKNGRTINLSVTYKF